jgi:prepilin-type N-terminal cleavage/methylation domain-containing protein
MNPRTSASSAGRLSLSGAAQRGFTLFETIIVISILALVSAGLLAMQPQVFKVQDTGRDQIIGLELMRSCAERLLAVRRQTGYANVSTTSCDGIGGIADFEPNPVVTLTDAANTAISFCSSATCTATISVAKTTGSVSLAPLTVQLSNY